MVSELVHSEVSVYLRYSSLWMDNKVNLSLTRKRKAKPGNFTPAVRLKLQSPSVRPINTDYEIHSTDIVKMVAQVELVCYGKRTKTLSDEKRRPYPLRHTGMRRPKIRCNLIGIECQ
jgi:hypothetical protein